MIYKERGKGLVNMNKVITISRQYGSGGLEIGKRVAEELNIPFYDNEIITQASKESGFAETVYKQAEDKATNSLLYSIAMGMSATASFDGSYMGMSIDDRIFLTQSNVIRKVAKEGPCVIVGRCADYVLKDFPNVVNIFICASLDYRIKRAILEYGLSKAKAADTILKYDKRRANYYNYHSGEKWGTITNYHMSIRSDFSGIEHSAHCIAEFIKSADDIEE